MEIYGELSLLPHFNPDLDKEKAPDIVEALRDKIKDADGVLICTPEYVFSVPGALKNAIEWCVSTTIFSEKPVALITASASGAKGKIDSAGKIVDALTVEQLKKLVDAFAGQLSGKKNH